MRGGRDGQTVILFHARSQASTCIKADESKLWLPKMLLNCIRFSLTFSVVTNQGKLMFGVTCVVVVGLAPVVGVVKTGEDTSGVLMKIMLAVVSGTG